MLSRTYVQNVRRLMNQTDDRPAEADSAMGPAPIAFGQWPCEVKHGTLYRRFDDNADGGLSVMVDQCGDLHVGVWDKKAWTSVEFCTLQGGGRSPRVRMALAQLADAIRISNEEDASRGETVAGG